MVAENHPCGGQETWERKSKAGPDAGEPTIQASSRKSFIPTRTNRMKSQTAATARTVVETALESHQAYEYNINGNIEILDEM